MKIDEYPVTTPDGMKYSGVFTVNLIAHRPEAVLETVVADGGDVYERTGVLPAEYMPEAPKTNANEFLVYNPGDVKTGLTLKVAGKGAATFTNMTTGQTCRVVGLTDEMTTNAAKWIEVNGD